jgi:hypothetical protein
LAGTSLKDRRRLREEAKDNIKIQSRVMTASMRTALKWLRIGHNGGLW